MMLDQRTRLSDKVAIVTGAGATGSGDFVGIGQAISILFARAGAKVLLADRDQANTETTLATIKGKGGEASVFVGDVTINADCRGMADAAVARYGRLNVLVNNVGISGTGSVTDVDEEFWDTVIDVNLKSVMLTSKFAIPRMIEDGGGSIINLSSVAGLIGSARAAAYGATKGAVRIFTKSAAVQYAKENIRVNSVHPGSIDTPMAGDRLNDPGLQRQANERTPLGRTAHPDEVAYGVLFLASDESSFMTGSELVIDGGATAQ